VGPSGVLGGRQQCGRGGVIRGWYTSQNSVKLRSQRGPGEKEERPKSIHRNLTLEKILQHEKIEERYLGFLPDYNKTGDGRQKPSIV